MGLDKDKIEAALLKRGLSTKRSKRLAQQLAKEDLLEDKKVKKKEEVKTVDITEVKKKEKEE